MDSLQAILYQLKAVQAALKSIDDFFHFFLSEIKTPVEK